MRNRRNQKRIQVAKSKSTRDQQQVLVLENKKNREFFRFENNVLVEYDLTKYDGRPVRLTDEEKAVAKDFS